MEELSAMTAYAYDMRLFPKCFYERGFQMDNRKIVVLTGATSGIGLAVAKALCEKGVHLIGTGRSIEKCESLQRELSEQYPGQRIVFLTADLSSLKNVRQLAEDIKKTVAEFGQYRVDALINNAGTFTSWYMQTPEGYEMQFAVNHLAPFLVTHLLMPLLRNSAEARVITTSSGSHYRTRIHWKDVCLRKHYNCLLAYKQSKLANVIFAKELGRRLKKDPNIRSFAFDPGLVNTEMGLKHTTGIAKLVWSIRKNSGDPPKVAADALSFMVFEPSLLRSEEVYFKAGKALKPNPHALSEENGKRLWELSEKMCGIRSVNFGL